MPFVGSIIPLSHIGVRPEETKARRGEDRRTEVRGEAFQRAMDEAELTVQDVEATEAIRPLKDNDSEESHEDRQEHGYYAVNGPNMPLRQPPINPTIDVEG